MSRRAGEEARCAADRGRLGRSWTGAGGQAGEQKIEDDEAGVRIEDKAGVSDRDERIDLDRENSGQLGNGNGDRGEVAAVTREELNL
jgi:hypothetical protein